MKIYEKEPEVLVAPKTEDSAEREAIKKTAAGEKKKLSSMTTQEKASYIWAYYKIPIIAFIIALIFLGYIINIVATAKTTMLMGVIINDNETNKASIEQSLATALNLTSKQKVDIQEGLFLTYSPQTGLNTGNMSGTSQILVFIMAKELDFYICDDQGLAYMESNKIAKDLKSYLPSEIYDYFESEGLIVRNEESIPSAINLTDTRVYELLGLHTQNAYLGISALSGHDEQVLEFVNWIHEMCK